MNASGSPNQFFGPVILWLCNLPDLGIMKATVKIGGVHSIWLLIVFCNGSAGLPSQAQQKTDLRVASRGDYCSTLQAA